MHLLMSSPRRGGGGGGVGRVGHRMGILTFSKKKIIKIPIPGQNIIVKINRNKWFSSHTPSGLDIDRCIISESFFFYNYMKLNLKKS